MLYVISCRNHPGLAYTGGQTPIVHLEADLYETVNWADGQASPWTFTPINARTGYNTQFYKDLAQLDQITWAAVRANDWRAGAIKEAKQAEFLVHETFPWHLVSCIGVINAAIKERVESILERAGHKPPVAVRRGWYY